MPFIQFFEAKISYNSILIFDGCKRISVKGFYNLDYKTLCFVFVDVKMLGDSEVSPLNRLFRYGNFPHLIATILLVESRLIEKFLRNK